MNKRGLKAAPEPEIETGPNRARRILGIPDRAETGKDVHVPGLANPIRLTILSNKQRREGHRAAREWCIRNGFNPEAAEGTNSANELSFALATQMLLRACRNPKGLFPLWGDGGPDTAEEAEEELNDDLTPEQIRWLEAQRQAFQYDVSPPLDEATPEFFAEVIAAAKKGRKGETLAAVSASWPRSTQLAFAIFMDAQLPKLTGWTLSPSTTTGSPDSGSSAAPG